MNVVRVNHSGTTIHNGYRRILIEDYQPGKLPLYIKIRGLNCKIFLPPGEHTNPVCNRCLQPGHPARSCDNEIACLFCKQQGHKRTACPQLREQYPTIAETHKTHTIISEGSQNNSISNKEDEKLDTEGQKNTNNNSDEVVHSEDQQHQQIEIQKEEYTPTSLIIQETTEDEAEVLDEREQGRTNTDKASESGWIDLSQHTVRESSQIQTPTSPLLRSKRNKTTTAIPERISSETFRNLQSSPIKRQYSSSSSEESNSKVKAKGQKPVPLPKPPAKHQRKKGVTAPQPSDYN